MTGIIDRAFGPVVKIGAVQPLCGRLRVCTPYSVEDNGTLTALFRNHDPCFRRCDASNFKCEPCLANPPVDALLLSLFSAGSPRSGMKREKTSKAATTCTQKVPSRHSVHVGGYSHYRYLYASITDITTTAHLSLLVFDPKGLNEELETWLTPTGQWTRAMQTTPSPANVQEPKSVHCISAKAHLGIRSTSRLARRRLGCLGCSQPHAEYLQQAGVSTLLEAPRSCMQGLIECIQRIV
ncbi:hypothetical protein V8C37DRAFT_383522, partial [Trichoderma ceciliae]